MSSRIKEEGTPFDMIRGKSFRINTEIRNSRNRPVKDKTSEEIKEDVEKFLEVQRKAKEEKMIRVTRKIKKESSND